jgi:hypothetical protein
LKAVVTTAAVLTALSTACASAPKPIVNRYGVMGCPAGAADALLSVDALECWFAARHGQWRTLSHESHYDVLVVKVETSDLRDAEDITRRFVATQSQMFSEITIYAQPETHESPARIRRVKWTRERGIDMLDFVAPAISRCSTEPHNHAARS